MNNRGKNTWALICGVLGCLCYGGGDWLMMYGNPSYTGKLIWLTTGTAQIPQWRYVLAMALPKHVKFIRHSDLSDGPSCTDEVIRR